MEINVTAKMISGKNLAVSSGSVSAEEFNNHTGLKVYDEDSKCLHALRSQQDSQVQKCVTEMSASEVERLLRSATIYSQPEHQSYLQDYSKYNEPSHYNHQDEKRTQEGHYENFVHIGSLAKKDVNCRENWQRTPHDEHSHSQFSRTHWELGHHYSNQIDYHYSSCQIRNCHSIVQDRPSSPHSGRFRRSCRINNSRSNGYPYPQSHDQNEVTACPTELCHVAARFIPSVDEDKVYCCYTSNIQTEKSNSHYTVLYSDPAHSNRVPSPICADDNPYTILHTIENSEPITAIFLGFHTTLDDSSQVQEFHGSLKAELVVIEEDHGEVGCMKEVKKCNQVPAGSSTKRNQERRVGLSFRNMKEKQKPCCTIC